MKTRLAIAVIIMVAVIACGKDKFETVPHLKLKSFSPSLVPYGETLRVRIEFTDKEGDVTDSIIIVRERLNVRKPEIKTPDPYAIPDFPKLQSGEFELNLDYFKDVTHDLKEISIPNTNPVQYETDTLRLKIVASDRAGHKSDTLVVNNVRVCRDVNVCQ